MSAPQDPCWPQFRGQFGAGVAIHGDFPTVFGPTTNALWQLDLSPGHSSPCIWGNHLFLTGLRSNQLETIAIDRKAGSILWRKAAPPVSLEKFSGLGSPACSTPVTDGQHLYVYFGSYGLLCYDFSGNVVWTNELPTPITQHGTGTSPILAGEYVILNCDQDIDSFLLAVNRTNGKQTWKTARPGFRRGYSTPLLWKHAEGDQIMVAGTLRLSAYDVFTGREIWYAFGLPNEMCASPIIGKHNVIVAGWTSGLGNTRMVEYDTLLAQADQNKDGQVAQAEAPQGPARQHFQYIDADKDGQITRSEWDSMKGIFSKARNALMAIQPNGKGDVTSSHVLWSQTRGLPYVPTPLYYNDRIYMIKNGGILSCYNGTNGNPVFLEERIGALGDYYASPVAANGKICCISQPGIATIIEAVDELKVLARNQLGEPVMATPAIIDNVIYIRTRNKLFAFANAQ